jgi:circadian clock protein KaiC
VEFDLILKGGFPRNRMCLLQGPPGSGKTTLALQFLLAGAEQGEKGAYITFSETAAELRQSAKSHGWSLNTISIVDLSKINSEFGADKHLPSFAWLPPTSKAITTYASPQVE